MLTLKWKPPTKRRMGKRTDCPLFSVASPTPVGTFSTTLNSFKENPFGRPFGRPFGSFDPQDLGPQAAVHCLCVRPADQ